MAEQYNNQEDSAIVKDSPSIHKKTKAVPTPEQNIGITLDSGVADVISELGTASKVDLAVLNSFTQVSQRRDELYKLLDTMGEDPTIAAILETYAEDATESNDAGQIVWVEASDSKINQYVNFLLDSMQVDKNIYKWVYSLCKYGDLYLQLYKKSEYTKDDFFITKDDKETLNEDVNVNLYKENDHYVHYIEMVPNPAQMFELTRFGKTSGYIRTDIKTLKNTANLLYSDSLYQYKFKKNDINIFNGDKFVHASLEDNTSRSPEEVKLFLDQDSFDSDSGTTYTVKRGQSLLYSAYKIWRELSLLENSMLLNRITKSAIVRLINVEVGDMPKEMVGPHLQGIKSLMEQKASINAGNSMTEYTNPGPIENNIYVPTYNGKGAITADQIGGDVNVGQLPDIDYFTSKFYGSMRVPKQYFGMTEDGAGFNGGQSLAIISSRYAKMIKRIQNAIIQALTDVINLMLLDKGLHSYVNQFTIKMQPPTTQEEIDRRENLSSKVAITSDIMNLLADVEDPVVKLKILKSLLSTIITDEEVITLIQEQIDNLEDQIENGITPGAEGGEEGDMNFESSGTGDFDNFDSGEPLNLDTELGLESEEGEEISDGDTLPTPADLGNIDFTDNNSDFDSE